MDNLKTPQISIIIPVYNVAPYIEACLESICSQTFRDFEILLVDDKGNDDSVSVADNFLKRKGTIPYRILEYGFNGGLSVARNCGLEAAKGEFVIFLDGDDTIELHMLERLYQLLTPGMDLSACGIRLVFPESETTEALPQPDYKEAITGTELLIDMLAGKYQAQIVKHLFRKSVFGAVRFPAKMLYEDMLTLPNLLLNTRKARVVPDPLYNYIQRTSSLSRRFNPELPGIFKFLDQTIGNVKANSTSTAALRGALKIYELNALFNISTNTVFATDKAQIAPVLKECRKRLKIGSLRVMAAKMNKREVFKAGLLSVLLVSPALFLKIGRKFLGSKK
ncbi:glycosyltransferase family 2 protein [Taibaiella chishuiensis]|uniref:Glycosyl transferase family 2 n=1 Tax=Taibaiella chishuiensis TaxID=1434707 RepID=A0A2P8DB67_9BACT|nr:glycosyltransferase family 2 protein [Taibaiella chishuiensis]PSK94463.1 glycosyl transferase family 2 [Taibaiella chishuiensis]